MDKATVRYLMTLVAQKMTSRDLGDLWPRWIFRRGREAERLDNDRTDYEFRWARSDRALEALDAVAAAHVCGKGGTRACRAIYDHEAFVAWPHLRRLLREAADQEVGSAKAP